MRKRFCLTVAMAGVLAAAGTAPAGAQIVVSANDAKIVLANGVNTVVPQAPPDTITILDASTQPVRKIAELHVPASVIGPPQSVAVSADGSLALVTSSTRLDPSTPAGTASNDVVTAIDLKASPPVVLATLHAGSGASGVSINRAGTLALVANRQAGTVSVFAIQGHAVTPAGTVSLNAPASGPSHVVFTPDGRSALVTRNNDSRISVLEIDGTHVTYAGHDVTAGLQPYGIDITPKGDAAVVAHIGAGSTGGVDTIALLDLTGAVPRTIDQAAAGITPEGLAISPDGRFVAIGVLNGTNAPNTAPFFHDFSRLRIFSLADRRLTPVTEARMGRWCQGVAWSDDGRRVLAQCMVDHAMFVFAFDGRTLSPAGTIAIAPGGPAGLRAAGR
jgi:DNA-binding beta-propeller fold protein YncE